MGNIIANEAARKRGEGELASLSMSNNLTSMLIGLLSLSASDLASDDGEIAFSLAIVGRDQDIYGRGCVGFEITNFPWKKERFDRDKQFLLDVIERARQPQLWARLSYQPHEESLNFILDRLQTMINLFYVTDIGLYSDEDLLKFKRDNLEKCEIHQVYLHKYGCVICGE